MTNQGTTTFQGKNYSIISEPQAENKRDLSGTCVRARALDEEKNEFVMEWEYKEDHGEDFEYMADWANPIAVY